MMPNMINIILTLQIDQSRVSLLLVLGIDDIMCVMTSLFDLHING